MDILLDIHLCINIQLLQQKNLEAIQQPNIAAQITIVLNLNNSTSTVVHNSNQQEKYP